MEIEEEERKIKVKHWNDRCLAALRNDQDCESDDMQFINRLKDEKNDNDLDLLNYKSKMSAEVNLVK